MAGGSQTAVCRNVGMWLQGTNGALSLVTVKELHFSTHKLQYTAQPILGSLYTYMIRYRSTGTLMMFFLDSHVLTPMHKQWHDNAHRDCSGTSTRLLLINGTSDPYNTNKKRNNMTLDVVEAHCYVVDIRQTDREQTHGMLRVCSRSVCPITWCLMDSQERYHFTASC